MTVRVMALAVVLMCVGCTPGMHRAYQDTMGGAAIAGWGAAGVMTLNALEDPSGTYMETRPVFGMGPRTQFVAFQSINIALVAAIRFLPERLFDEHTPWVKDVLLTTCAVMGGADAYSDYRLTH